MWVLMCSCVCLRYGMAGIMGVEVSAVAAALPIGDFRPLWTRPAPWFDPLVSPQLVERRSEGPLLRWDAEADAHLILGTYRHGYGKYDMMVADPELCFGRRLDEYTVSTCTRASRRAPLVLREEPPLVLREEPPLCGASSLTHHHSGGGRRCCTRRR